MERTRKELQSLQTQVEKGALKEPEKIGAAAAAKLRRNHDDWHSELAMPKGLLSITP